jgi:hypothetical protein
MAIGKNKKASTMDPSIYISEPYEAKTANKLQAYLQEQSSGSKQYDFSANKALIKYYQAFPEAVNVDAVVAALVLSMTQLPFAADFLALTCITPASVLRAPEIVAVTECAELLEKGEFKAFWTKSVAAGLAKKMGSSHFEGLIRTSILRSVQICYSTIEVGMLRDMLGGADVATICKSMPELVSSCSATEVVMVPCVENSKSSMVRNESLKFSEVNSLLTQLRVP